jgi:leucyl-tRNA synthetase
LAEASKLLESDKRLWRTVQSTIKSVTNSYSSTYSLNTVVSDLMALTKVVSQFEYSVPLQRLATMVLVQLLAPIAPATAEECWSRLNSRPSRASIFAHPFPTADETLDLLASQTQTCAVQVNGKLKFAAAIALPDRRLRGKDLETWIVREILGTEEGKTKLVGPLDVRRARRVVVVRGGKTVNFVM